MNTDTEIKSVGSGSKKVGSRYKVFWIDGTLVAFDKMRQTEGLSHKRLFEALDSDIKPFTTARDLKQARIMYDSLVNDSEEETAALKQLAKYYPASNDDEALAPILHYGSDSERTMVGFRNQQRAIEAAGGPSTATMILHMKEANKRK